MSSFISLLQRCIPAKRTAYTSLVCRLRQRTNTTRTPRRSSQSQSPSLPKNYNKLAEQQGEAAPTPEQLRNYFLTTAIPMVGFGFMDQTILIQAGNAIDCSIGVTMGLSTLAAAGLGSIVSGAGGVFFGGSLDTLMRRLDIVPRSGLTSAQRSLHQAKRAALAGSLVGVTIGSLLGLVNLLFIDTEQSTMLKWQAQSEANEFAYEIDASNIPSYGSIFKVRGPDIDGLLAAITTALTVNGYSLVEVHATNRKRAVGESIEDVFVVRTRQGANIPDDELQDVANDVVLEATRSPQNLMTVKTQNKELEAANLGLRNRVQKLEQLLNDCRINVIIVNDENK